MRLGVFRGFVSVGTGQAIGPKSISPGRAGGVAVVGEFCPTFSWTSVDWAVGYRVTVFEALGVNAVTYEEMAATGAAPVLIKEIDGQGLSWTPSTEEGLITVGLYVWYVEAKSVSGPGLWSVGNVFIVDAGAGILGEAARAAGREVAEDLIARLELPGLPSDRFDPPRDVLSEDRIPGFEQPAGQAGNERLAPQEMPVGGIEGCRPDLDQDFIVLGNRPFDLLVFKDVRGTVFSINNGFHFPSPSAPGDAAGPNAPTDRQGRPA